MTTRPRILQVFKTANPETAGGIPTVMTSIVRNLGDRFDFGFLIASNRGATLFESHLGVPVKAVRHFGHIMSLPIAPTFPLHLRRIENDYDLVALHAPFPLADMADYLGASRRKPLVVHWHADVVRQVRLKSLYVKPMQRSLQRAKAVIVSGSPLMQSSDFLRAVAEKCRVIPFGVDTDYWGSLAVDDAAAADRIKTTHPRLILAVGRLVSYKGFHILIDAMNRIDGELWIVGKGPLENVLRQRIADGSASDRIRLLGDVPRPELRQLYHAAKLLCFPSISNAEAFGIVQLEAMSAGLPVVNTSLDTMAPQVARDMQEGLTVPPLDSQALAEAVTRLLDDDDLRVRLGRAALARSVTIFSEKAFLESIANVYDDVLITCKQH